MCSIFRQQQTVIPDVLALATDAQESAASAKAAGKHGTGQMLNRQRTLGSGPGPQQHKLLPDEKLRAVLALATDETESVAAIKPLEPQTNLPKVK